MAGDKPAAAALAAVEEEATNDGDGSTQVPLGDTHVQVLPPEDWPSSAQRALREGDSDSWAEKCLATDEDYKTWQDVDPTIGEVEEFFDVWSNITGQTVGKSRRSAKSSRSTRRR